jgi:hypothetical protein
MSYELWVMSREVVGLKTIRLFGSLMSVFCLLISCDSPEQERGSRGPEPQAPIVRTAADTSRPVNKQGFSKGKFFADIDIYRMEG